MRKYLLCVLALVCFALPILAQDPDSTAGPGAPSAQSPVPDCVHFKHYRDTLTGDAYNSSGVPCSWVKQGGGGSAPSGPVGSLQQNAGGSLSALPLKTTIQAPSGAQFIFKGDSLTFGAGLTSATQSYAARFGNCTLSGSPLTCTATNGMSFAGPSATVVNLGISGETLATAWANYTTEVHPYCIQATATVPVYLHLDEGINDIRVNGSSAATIEGLLTNYWAAAVADGCTVTAATLTPTGDLTTTGQATRLAVNAWIRSQVGFYSYLDDLNQLLPDPYDATWYQSDKIHFNASAALQIAGYINSLWTGKSGFQGLQSVDKSGWFLNTFTPVPTYGGIQAGKIGNGGNIFYVDSAAPTDQKLIAFGIDDGGSFSLAFNNDAYNSGTTPLVVSRSGINATTWALLGTSLKFTGSNPCYQWHDTGGTADVFVGEFVNIGLFGVNRNPCTGTFTDSGKTAATIQINSTAGGTTSNIQFLVTATANSAPSTVVTVDNGGITIPGIKATTGTRYVCVDTTGKLVSQTTACSGT